MQSASKRYRGESVAILKLLKGFILEIMIILTYNVTRCILRFNSITNRSEFYLQKWETIHKRTPEFRRRGNEAVTQLERRRLQGWLKRFKQENNVRKEGDRGGDHGQQVDYKVKTLGIFWYKNGRCKSRNNDQKFVKMAKAVSYTVSCSTCTC